jgi:tetratricopeptide (TPR) repeat protein
MSNKKENYPGIKERMERNEYNEALLLIKEKLEQETSNDKKIELKLLKCTCFNQLEKFKECQKLASTLLINSNFDSYSKENKFKIFQTLTISFFEMGKFDDALETLQQATLLFRGVKLDKNNIDWLQRKANYHFWLGRIYRSKGELDLSSSHLEKSLAIDKQYQFKEGIVGCLNNLGVVYWYKGEIETAKKYFINSLEYLTDKRKKNQRSRILSNIGSIYGMQGNLNEALEYFIEALEISQEINNITNIGSISHNIGEVYSRKGELDLAEKYLEIALENKRKIGNKRYLASSFQVRGSVYFKKGELKKSFKDYSKALEYFKEIENLVDTAPVYDSIITILLEQNSLEKAKKYHKELKQLVENDDNKIVDLWYRLSLAKIYRSTKSTAEELTFESLHKVFERIVKAKEIFQEIIESDIIEHLATVDAIFNLSELLIIEMKTLGEESFLKEIKQLSKRLLNLGEKQNSYDLLAKTYLLEAKLALLEADIEKAKEYLQKALIITEEKGFERLGFVVAQEQNYLEKDLPKYLLEKDTSFMEKLTKIKLDGLIVSMRQDRVENYHIDQKVEAPGISELTNFANVLKKRKVAW